MERPRGLAQLGNRCVRRPRAGIQDPASRPRGLARRNTNGDIEGTCCVAQYVCVGLANPNGAASREGTLEFLREAASQSRACSISCRATIALQGVVVE